MQLVGKDQMQLGEVQVKLFGSSSFVTLAHVNESVHVYDAVNKSDDRETKLMASGMFILK